MISLDVIYEESYWNWMLKRPSQYYGPYYHMYGFIDRIKGDREFSDKWLLSQSEVSEILKQKK